MANEATVKLEATQDTKYGARRYKVADGTAIAKGTLMVLSAESAGDNPTAIAHSASHEFPVGFALESKEANDGATSIAVQTTGIVDAVASGSVTFGHLVITSPDANQVLEMPSVISNGSLNALVGRCLETASDGEKVRVSLMIP